MKRASRWVDLGRRVAELKDGESIVLECERNLAEEARKIRNGLNGVAACILGSPFVIDSPDKPLQSDGTPKKPYNTPRLGVYGDLRKLTHTVGNKGNADGGHAPTFRTR